MFSKISQIGRNLSDEITRINDEVSNARRQPSQSPSQTGQIDPATAAKVLHTETPNPDTLIQPEDPPTDGESPAEEYPDTTIPANAPLDSDKNTSGEIDIKSPQPTTFPLETTRPTSASTATPSSIPSSTLASPSPQQEALKNPAFFVPGTNIKYNDLPIEIRGKMKKFTKYEEKYPVLFEAYKVEKKKTFIISSFEKMLQETTPCSSIADADTLKGYLTSLTSKSDMLTGEMRKLTASESMLTKEKAEVDQRVNELNAQIATLQKEKASIQSEKTFSDKQWEDDAKKIKYENVKLNETIKSLKEENASLEIKLKETQENSTSNSVTEEQEKKLVLLQAENTKLSTKLTLFTEEKEIAAEKLVAALEASETSKSECSSTIKSLESDLAASKESIHRLTAEHKVEINDLTSKILDLESSVESNTKLAQLFKQKVVTLTEESRLKSEARTETQASTSKETANKGSGKNTKKKNNKKKKNQHRQEQDTQAEITEEAGEEDTKDTEIVPSTEESSLTNDHANLIELQHNYDSLNTKYTALKDIEVELKVLRDEHSTLTKEYESLKETSSNEKSDVTSQIGELSKEASELKSKLRAKDEEIENMRDMLRDVGDSLVSAKDEIKALKDNNGNSSALERGLSEKAAELDAIKSEFEYLRVQNSDAVKDYEITKSSLSKKLESAINESKSLSAELNIVKQSLKEMTSNKEEAEKNLQEKENDVNELNKTINELKIKQEIEMNNITKSQSKLSQTMTNVNKENEDLQKKVKELSQFKSNEVQLKLDLASAKTSLSHKEKIQRENESRIRYLEEEKVKLNDTLIELKVEISELRSQNNTFTQTKNNLTTKNENLKQEYNELMLKMNKMGTENNKLIKNLEEFKDKYNEAKDLKANSSIQSDSMKRRCEELAMRTKEYENRVDMLEEELSEARSMLQERSREAGTMRKLLMEAEESQSLKLKEINARLSGLLEEKEKLENETTMTLKKKQRDIEEMKMKLERITSDFQALKLKNAEVDKKLSEQSKQAPIKQTTDSGSPSNTNGSSTRENYNSKLIESLRESLNDCETRTKNLENVNSLLKKSNDETHQKLIRMNKRYKLLSQQYRTIRDRRSSVGSIESAGSSPKVSRSGSIVAISGLSGADLVSQDNEKLDEVKEKVEYIKNVLLGFLEHKEQRMILLPVIKTLLYLNDSDEQRLLSSLNKP